MAPWKQRRTCVIVRELPGGKEWDIVSMNDEEVKDAFPLISFIPKTKTACNKMEKDDLYLICTMYEIHSPKKTKKMMLELIGEKLKPIS